MVSRPGEYTWSSYAANASGNSSEILTPHDVYQGLGVSKEQRCSAYRQMVDEALDEQSLKAIRSAAHYCQPLGDERFLEFVEAKLGVPLGQRGRGRPRTCE